MKPEITKGAWTYDFVGECAYCGKPCRRTRTFYATERLDADAQAGAEVLCHRKCGGY